jgi:hypothetical protein
VWGHQLSTIAAPVGSFHSTSPRQSEPSPGWARVMSGARTVRASTERMDMRKVWTRGEQGITTAEYAVGTAAGAGLAGLLYKLLTGGFGDQLLRTLFDHVLGLLGIG